MKKVEFYGSLYSCSPKIIEATERDAIRTITKQLEETSTYEMNLIINSLWLDSTTIPQLEAWIKTHAIPGSTQIIIIAFVDGFSALTEHIEYKKIITNYNYPVKYIGYSSDNWQTICPKWFGKLYDIDELTLNDKPKYVYLSYNRKPNNHRHEFVRSILKYDILEKGWVTFQFGYYHEIDCRVSQEPGLPDVEIYKDLIIKNISTDFRYSRPEDITSIGNLNIWKNSYCIVVNETDSGDPWHLSEKIWKPIMGLRPFLFNRPNLKHDLNHALLKIFKQLNLYTPGELFSDPILNSFDIEYNVQFLKKLCDKTPEELYEMWCQQRPMLDHNRKIFEQVREKEITL